jgi:hypothetical protein
VVASNAPGAAGVWLAKPNNISGDKNGNRSEKRRYSPQLDSDEL